MPEVYVLTKAGVLHTGYRAGREDIGPELQTSEGCNLDDAEIDQVFEQDDEGKVGIVLSARHCGRCFPEPEGVA